MDATTAQQGGGALPTNETARVQAGRIGDEGEQTTGIVGVSQPPGKPLSAVDADLVEFQPLKDAATRQGFAVQRLVAHGQPIYLVSRQTYRGDFHSLQELREFMAARGIKP